MRHQGTSNNRDADEDNSGEDDEDDNRDPHGISGDPETGSRTPLLRLACPYHKKNPAKYCIQHGTDDNSKKTDYRSCEGPGFKNIQRLK